MTIDLHAPQIQGFFDIPVDHIFASPVLVRHLTEMQVPDLVVASPDVGSIKMARAYAKRVHGELAFVDKRRLSGEVTEVCHVIGEVEGRNVVFVDDMISTGGTIANAARVVRERGARKVYIFATHPVLCGAATQVLSDAPVERVFVTDSVPIDPEKMAQCPKLQVLTVSDLIGEAIRRIHTSQSVSSLFLKI